MVRVRVIYPNGEGAFFDMDYYMSHHIPILANKLGDVCKKIEIEGMAQMEGQPPPKLLSITYLTFETAEAYHAAYDPLADAAAANRPFFTNVAPLFEIDDIG
ncbi:MAG: EthD family reductase [Ancalomicrobiaceae bacterium]|nr:EthD family reductase [Ancalomicrobiaceae bacterium]